MKTKFSLPILLFFLFIFNGCKKQDIIEENFNIDKTLNEVFFRHENPLSPTVSLVLNNAKNSMSGKQISSFIKNAGLLK